MRKLMKCFLVVVLAVVATEAGLAIAAHAPHYPKKDHPVLRQKKNEHKAKKKAKAMEVKKGLLHHG
jgi:hypothetical protein